MPTSRKLGSTYINGASAVIPQMFRMIIFQIFCIIFLVACVGLPVLVTPASAAPQAVDLTWKDISQQFVEDYYHSHPSFAAFQGRHQYDGILPDWSQEGIAQEVMRLKSWKLRLAAFNISAARAQSDPVVDFERKYLLAKIEQDLFWLEDARWPFRNPDFYFNWMMGDMDFDMYISRPYAPLLQRLAAFIKYCKALPLALQQIEDNLQAPIPEPYSRYGAQRFRGMANFMAQTVPNIFATAIDPHNVAEFDQALKTAINGLQKLALTLEARQATVDNPASFAIGPSLFAKMLKRTEAVKFSLSELEAIGRADLVRNQAQLKSTCAHFAPGLDVGGCISRNAAIKPEQGSVVAARQQLLALKQFIIDKAIVSIPGTEQALVATAPDYAIGWGAYIQSPGPYDWTLPSVYYIAPPDPGRTEKQQLEYQVSTSDLLFTSVHEVWPGHFLHSMHANRAQSELRRVFFSYAFSEGWAHYSEELMWDAGFGGSQAGVHIGQLSNALLRNIRFLVALGLHTQGMTSAQAQAMFIEQGFQNEALARDEAWRAQYEPTVINYLLGKLLILQLRDSWLAQNPENPALKVFHDQLLSLGGPPVPLATEALELKAVITRP